VYPSAVTSASSELRDVLLDRGAHEDAKPHRAGFRFKSYEAFVLAYGRGYVSAPLDRRERAHVQQMLRGHRTWWQRGFAYNLCFTNSQELMAFDATGKVIYVEGYVWAYGDRLPPVHHGWLSLHGKVLDVTAVTRTIAHPDKLPPEPPQLHGEFDGRAYFGERRKLNRGHGSLLNDEDAGYPMLAHGGEGAVRGLKRV